MRDLFSCCRISGRNREGVEDVNPGFVMTLSRNPLFRRSKRGNRLYTEVSVKKEILKHVSSMSGIAVLTLARDLAIDSNVSVVRSVILLTLQRFASLGGWKRLP